MNINNFIKNAEANSSYLKEFSDAVFKMSQSDEKKYVYMTPSGWKALNEAEGNLNGTKINHATLKTILKSEECKKIIQAQTDNYEWLINAVSYSEKFDFSIKNGLHIVDEQEEAEKIYNKVRENYEEIIKNDHELEQLNLIVSGESLCPAGLNIIVDRLKSKSSGDKINCFICKDLFELENSLKQINNSNFSGKIAFLVKSAQFQSDTIEFRHITPVLIEKNKTGTKIIIMDSVGSEAMIMGKNDPYYDKIREIPFLKHQQYIQNVYNRIVDSGINAEVYYPKDKRQKDSSSCSIFGINDVVQFFKNDDIFSDLEKKGKIEVHPNDPNLKRISNLHPSSMKTMQSVSLLEGYYAMNKNESLFTVEGPFFESVRKNIRVNKKENNKQVNMKAQDRFAKYLEVINNYLENIPIDELKDLSNKYDSSNLQLPKDN